MRYRGGISRVLVAAVVVILAAVLGIAVFVWSPWSTGPSTTSTVNTPPSLLAVTGQSPDTSCFTPTGTYSNSSLSVNWGNLAPGTEGIEFVCLKNTGTTGITLAVSSTLSPTLGRVTSPQSGKVLPQGTLLFELDLHLTSSVQTGQFPSFTITIGGSS